MTSKTESSFRAAPRFQAPEIQGQATVEGDDYVVLERHMVSMERNIEFALHVESARALRDWLTSVLPNSPDETSAVKKVCRWKPIETGSLTYEPGCCRARWAKDGPDVELCPHCHWCGGEIEEVSDEEDSPEEPTPPQMWYCSNCKSGNRVDFHHTSCPACGKLRPAEKASEDPRMAEVREHMQHYRRGDRVPSGALAPRAAAVKLYREIHGCGLRQAVAACDAL